MKTYINLVHGDCLEKMLSLDSEAYDCVMSDPPYGMDFQSGHRKGRNQFIKIDNDQSPFIWYLYHSYRVLKPTGCIFVFCNWRSWTVFYNALTSARFCVMSTIVWDKMSYGMGDLKRSFASSYELVIFAVKTSQFLFPDGRRPKDLISIPRVDTGRMLHPNEKPVSLYEYLIRHTTKEGDWIIDPFAGSASAGIAASNTKRNYIGIEINPNYYNVAKQRLASAIGAPQKNGDHLEYSPIMLI